MPKPKTVGTLHRIDYRFVFLIYQQLHLRSSHCKEDQSTKGLPVRFPSKVGVGFGQLSLRIKVYGFQVSKPHQFVRLVLQKEEHGLKVKEEIRVIWGDYFKTPQFESFPEIHDLAHSIMLECSKSKQTLSKDSTLKLLEKVNRFAEIFWLSKNVKVFRQVCPYPPQQELIYPDLK